MNNVLSLLEKLQSKHLSVNSIRCVAVRNRNTSCTKCADICPTGTISIHDNSLVVTPENCTGCGLCATACPTGALETNNPNSLEILKQAVAVMKSSPELVTIACEPLLDSYGSNYKAEKAVSVPCLNYIDESVLIALAAAGVQEIALVAGSCDKCDLACGVALTEQIIENSKNLLECWQNATEIKMLKTLPLSLKLDKDLDYDPSRRNFLSSMRDEIKRAASITVDHIIQEKLEGSQSAGEEGSSLYARVQDDGTLPHFLPEQRGLLLLSLAQLGIPEDLMMDSRLFGHVIVDKDRCSSCMMCATFCPTKAIRKFGNENATEENPEPFGIEHYTGRCVQCRCCEDICLENALELSTDVFVRDIIKKDYSERIPMDPRAKQVNQPKSIMFSLRGLINTPEVYER